VLDEPPARALPQVIRRFGVIFPEGIPMDETCSFVLSSASAAKSHPSGESLEADLTPPPPGDLPSSTGPGETLPRAFGNYELLEVVGRGGMGVVYKACQKSLNRVVALKMIVAGRLGSESALRRFCQEAEAAARLDHPAIVSVYEFDTLEGQPFFSMAYVPGINLQKRAQVIGLPTLVETLSHVQALVDAVDYAHQQGIIHRDLKPENVLIDRNGRPRLVDFGVAKSCAAGTEPPLQTLSGELVGTPVYMAPEQALGDPSRVGPLVDVYGLGGLLYFLLTGRPPFTGATVTEVIGRVLHEPPMPPRLLNPHVPAELEAICLKCLHKDPACRYSSARTLGAALAKVSLPEAPAPAPGRTAIDAPSVPGPAPRQRKWRRAGLILLVLGAMLGIGLSLPGWLSPDAPGKKSGPQEAIRDFPLDVQLLGATRDEVGNYHLAPGEVQLSFQVGRDAYVGVWSIEADGAGGTRVVQVFPSSTEPDHFTKADQETRVSLRTGPSAGSGYDQLWIVATTERWEPHLELPEGAYQRLQAKVGRHGLRLRWVRAVEPIAEAVLRYHVAGKP